MNIKNGESASTTDVVPKLGKTWYGKVKSALHIVTKAVLMAPVKLPAKIKAGAQYLTVLLGIWDSLERSDTESEDVGPDSEEGELPHE